MSRTTYLELQENTIQW